MSVKADVDHRELIKLLNEALRLEYTFIVYYPRLAAGIEDAETKKLVQHLGTASVHHADVVAEAITGLGGEPDWSFTPLPDDKELLPLFQMQLQKEQRALELHHKAAELVPAEALSGSIKSLAQEEQAHISTIEKIIARLKQ